MWRKKMKKLGILAMIISIALSGCSGGNTEQTRTTVSDQSILPSNNTRTPISQTTNSDNPTPPKSESESNTSESETSYSSNQSGDSANSESAFGR